jgi:hypothetical protein
MVQNFWARIPLKPLPCDEIIVNLLGRFGNQLFQLAYALQISEENNLPIRLLMQKGPFPFALGILGLKIDNGFKLVNGDFVRIEKPKHSYRCGFFEYTHLGAYYLPIQNPPRHLILNGYFQSERYFPSNSDELRKILLSKLSIDLKSEFEYEYVAHIRLGDYVTKKQVNAIHGHVDEIYLARALSQLGWDQSKKICVVTDDPNSFRILFPNYEKLVSKVQNTNQIEDFKTIARANNKIISNSTFSWWAAWVGQGNVVAPKKWYANMKILEEAKNDLLPANWTQL